MLLKAGGPRQRFWFAASLMGWIYPQVSQDAHLWNGPTDLESVLAEDAGEVHLFWDGDELRRLGIAALSPWHHFKTTDQTVFTMTRVMNAAIGQPQRAQTLIAAYQRGYANLQHDLRPQTITFRPRVLEIVNSASDWTRLSMWDEDELQTVGISTASDGYRDTGRQEEAERILAMDPDIVVVRVGSAPEFLRDVRWQGLRAVRNRRVYGNPYPLRSWTYSLDGRPLGARWLAEIAHPERLQPKMRTLIRDYYVMYYRHRFSQDDIDKLLHVVENTNSWGYARFTKNGAASAHFSVPDTHGR